MNASSLLRIVFRPIIKRAARGGLIGRSRARDCPEMGRFTRVEVDEIVKEAWKGYEQLAPSVPKEPKLGNRMNILLSCLTLACLQVLTSKGIARDHAIDLIGDVAWKVYETWGKIPLRLSRIRHREPRDRLEMSVNLFLRFPFTAPGYRFVRRPTARGIDVEMLRCPVAEYFREHDAADLCVGTWCNLDFALAELWQGRLERTETLASGGIRCDFRFEVRPENGE